MARLSVPSLLRPLCNGETEIDLPGGTLEALLRAADVQCPGFYERVVDAESHRLRVDLALALDGEVVTLYLHETIDDDAHLAIVPAIAGG